MHWGTTCLVTGVRHSKANPTCTHSNVRPQSNLRGAESLQGFQNLESAWGRGDRNRHSGAGEQEENILRFCGSVGHLLLTIKYFRLGNEEDFEHSQPERQLSEVMEMAGTLTDCGHTRVEAAH